ncbi:unnamed protein product [Discosporangium mesarthrocarpum]
MYQEFLGHEHHELWAEATMAELNGLLEAGAFLLSSLPPGRKALGANRMIKWNINERIVVRTKARLVARGFHQRGLDYLETFAPTPSPGPVRLLAAVACGA